MLGLAVVRGDESTFAEEDSTAVRGCVNTGLDTVRLAPNSLPYFLSSGEEEGLLVVGEEAPDVVWERSIIGSSLM